MARTAGWRGSAEDRSVTFQSRCIAVSLYTAQRRLCWCLAFSGALKTSTNRFGRWSNSPASIFFWSTCPMVVYSSAFACDRKIIEPKEGGGGGEFSFWQKRHADRQPVDSPRVNAWMTAASSVRMKAGCFFSFSPHAAEQHACKSAKKLSCSLL